MAGLDPIGAKISAAASSWPGLTRPSRNRGRRRRREILERRGAWMAGSIPRLLGCWRSTVGAPGFPLAPRGGGSGWGAATGRKSLAFSAQRWCVGPTPPNPPPQGGRELSRSIFELVFVSTESGNGSFRPKRKRLLEPPTKAAGQPWVKPGNDEARDARVSAYQGGSAVANSRQRQRIERR